MKAALSYMDLSYTSSLAGDLQESVVGIVLLIVVFVLLYLWGKIFFIPTASLQSQFRRRGNVKLTREIFLCADNEGLQDRQT